MDASRLALEVNLLAQVSTGSFSRSANTLFFTESIEIGSNVFKFRITFPERYPFAAPRVHLLFPALQPSVETHMFQDGSLCLHATDEWHPQHTGIWIRNRAIGWIAALLSFSDTGQWPQL